jgi:hypothetical protein
MRLLVRYTVDMETRTYPSGGHPGETAVERALSGEQADTVEAGCSVDTIAETLLDTSHRPHYSPPRCDSKASMMDECD